MSAQPLSVPRIDPTAAAAIANVTRAPKRRRAQTARASYEANRRPVRRGRDPLMVTLAEMIRAKYRAA
jgi:hypothetical protein